MPFVVVKTVITHPDGKPALDRLMSPVECAKIFDFFGTTALRQRLVVEGKIVNRSLVTETKDTLTIVQTYRDMNALQEHIGDPVMVKADQQLQAAGYTQTSSFVS